MDSGVALPKMPDDVRACVEAALAVPGEGAARGRALVRALRVAERAGANAVALIGGSGVVRMVGAEGRPFGLVVLAFSVPEYEAGHPDDIRRLVRALDGSLGPWRFLMHLRRPVPPNFDPDPVARAVHLWRMAMDRGEWRGRHAVYEDDLIALDLSVLMPRSDDRGGGMVGTVPPITASDRLAIVYRQLLVTMATLAETMEPGLPLIVALSAEPAWRLPRGHVLELLYGLPDEVLTIENGREHHYEASYRASGLSLFSDPSCRDLAGLWWLEPDGEGIAGQSHDNPWCPGVGAVLFPGSSYRPLEPVVEGKVPDRGPVRMASMGRGVQRVLP